VTLRFVNAGSFARLRLRAKKRKGEERGLVFSLFKVWARSFAETKKLPGFIRQKDPAGTKAKRPCGT
jgi:hypothetical protein